MLVLLGTAYAANLTIKEKEIPNGPFCQCSLLSYTYTVENTGDTKVPVTVSVYGEYGSWASVAPGSVELAPGTQQTINVFITPKCYAEPGDYSFYLNVTGDNNMLSEKITVPVKNCHTASVEVPSQTICINEPLCFTAEVKNTGNFDKEGISVSAEGGEIKGNTSFALNKGDTRNVEMCFDAKSEQGKYEVALSADIPKIKDATSTAQGTGTMTVSSCAQFVLDVYSGKIGSPSAEAKEVCAGDTAEFIIGVKNTGKVKDTYT
ncbi:hypothetical protein COY95_01270, partial [Candidatus Woesearchaeota archaeon CG_4_10_14_0_8_um_filter_47_5]